MKPIERNIVESFNMAKSDIKKLQSIIVKLNDDQKTLQNKVAVLEKKLNGNKTVAKKVVKKATSKRHTTRFVSAKDSKKFHVEACPFAKNIMPKKRVYYKSKTKALNEGLKPCKCIK
jgi:peroxiredoxin family protein